MQPGRGNAEPWLLIHLLLMLLAASHGAQYKVGDDSGWQLGTDLSSWGSRNSYQPEPVSSVVFDTQGQHPVYQVTLADYQACNIGNPLQQHTGGTVVVTLGTARTYYFICGIPGHCLAGMKLTIDVHASAVPPAASSPVKTPIAPASPPLAAALPPAIVPSPPLSPPPTSNPPPPKSAPTPQEQLPPPPAPAPLAPSPVPAPASLAPSPVPPPASLTPSPVSAPTPTLAATSPSTAPVQPPVEPLLPPDVAAPSIASSPALPGFDASATPSQAPVPASGSSSNRVFLTPGIMLVAMLLLWSSTL